MNHPYPTVSQRTEISNIQRNLYAAPVRIVALMSDRVCATCGKRMKIKFGPLSTPPVAYFQSTFGRGE